MIVLIFNDDEAFVKLILSCLPDYCPFCVKMYEHCSCDEDDGRFEIDTDHRGA